MGAPEAWLRGPIEGYDRAVMPAVHALIQAREDVVRTADTAADVELWQRPGGAAAAGFHLHHVAGALDRLFTYARGEQLTDAQKAAMAQEGQAQPSAAELVLLVNAGVYIGEMWDLEALAEDCAADGRYSFFLSAAPLTITGSVGSPINPIAVK